MSMCLWWLHRHCRDEANACDQALFSVVKAIETLVVQMKTILMEASSAAPESSCKMAMR